MKYVAIVVKPIPDTLEPMYVLENYFEGINIQDVKEHVIAYIAEQYGFIDEEKIMQAFDDYIMLFPVKEITSGLMQIDASIKILFNDGPDLSGIVGFFEEHGLSFTPRGGQTSESSDTRG